MTQKLSYAHGDTCTFPDLRLNQSESTNNSPLTSAIFKAWLWPQGTAAWRPHRHVYTNKHCVNTSFLVPLNHPYRQKVEVRARSDRVEHRAHLLQSPRAVQQKKESTDAERRICQRTAGEDSMKLMVMWYESVCWRWRDLVSLVLWLN